MLWAPQLPRLPTDAGGNSCHGSLTALSDQH